MDRKPAQGGKKTVSLLPLGAPMSNFLSYYDTRQQPSALRTQEREAVINQVIDRSTASFRHRSYRGLRLQRAHRSANGSRRWCCCLSTAATGGRYPAEEECPHRRTHPPADRSRLSRPAPPPGSHGSFRNSPVFLRSASGDEKRQRALGNSQLRPEPEEIWRVLDRLLGPAKQKFERNQPFGERAHASHARRIQAVGGSRRSTR